MVNIDLVRFLSDSATELLGKAESAPESVAKLFLDEAEELLALAGSLLEKPVIVGVDVKEAA